jgi:hypothetical protein
MNEDSCCCTIKVLQFDSVPAKTRNKKVTNKQSNKQGKTCSSSNFRCRQRIQETFLRQGSTATFPEAGRRWRSSCKLKSRRIDSRCETFYPSK